MEERIRRQIGEEIVKDLPINVKSDVFYNGALSIEDYRRYFPTRDSVETAYLTLRDLFSSDRIVDSFLEYIEVQNRIREQSKRISENSREQEIKEFRRLFRIKNNGLHKLLKLLKKLK